MFHNVYQRFNDFRLLNKSPWNILFHAQQLLDLGVRNEELGVIYIKYVRAYKEEGYTLLMTVVGHY